MAGSQGGAGSGGQGGAPAGLTAPAPQGLAVVNSDYVSTSISLLTSAGALARPVCVHSTTTGSGSSTLSNDVVLPSQPQLGGNLVLIDRGNVALTTVDPASCTITNQISVKGGLQMANPHDVVMLSATKAYVTRYNNDPTATDPLKAGDDILIVQPANGTVLGHIDVSAYRAPIDGGSPANARPDRALIAAGLVAVSLNELDNNQNYAEGRVILIDPASDRVVQSIALTGRRNCEAMDYVSDTRTLLVACGGTFGAPSQTTESGVAVVDLSQNPAVVMPSISGQVFGSMPTNAFWIAAAPSASAPHRAFAGTFGTFTPAAPDTVFLFDFELGTHTSFLSSGAFALGMGAVAGDRLLIPDGATAMPRIHLYDISGPGTPAEISSFPADTTTGLPPREVGWF